MVQWIDWLKKEGLLAIDLCNLKRSSHFWQGWVVYILEREPNGLFHSDAGCFLFFVFFSWDFRTSCHAYHAAFWWSAIAAQGFWKQPLRWARWLSGIHTWGRKVEKNRNGQRKRSNYSFALRSDILVNIELHMQWWSRKVIMKLKKSYYLVTL